MRRYALVSPTARSGVDLKDFSNIIEDAVHSIMPRATVKVEADCYYVSPTPRQGEAVKIGRLICQSALSQYCVHIPKLFTSKEVKEEEADGKESSQPLGGHH